MSEFYDRAIETLARLVAKYGEPAVIRRRTTSGPDYDPALSGPQDTAVHILTVKNNAFEVSQGRVRATDKQVLMTPDIEPRLTDKLVVGGVTYALVGPNEGKGIGKSAPGGQVIAYRLQCRT